MKDVHFALLDTAIGPVGVLFGTSGIVGLQLPEVTPEATRRKLAQRAPGATEVAPPRMHAAALEALAALLRGEPVDLASIPLDLSGVPPFHRRVYEAARAIPVGATCTYGELATAAGSPGGSRAVGQALGRNPFPLVVPCHRVVAAGGKLGGFTAHGGVATKERLLAIERRSLVRPQHAEDPSALPYDPAHGVAWLREADPLLAPILDAVGPCRLARSTSASHRAQPDVFDALAESVVYQQLHAKAARTIWERVGASMGGAVTAEGVERTDDATLRAAGLSGAKLAALRDLARKTLDGTLPERAALDALDDEAIVERLTVVRGIGRWTVEMLLLFWLGRPDVLPLDDFGIRKAFGRLAPRTRVKGHAAGLADRAQLARRGARWSPYRSLASWYLWRSLELPSAPSPSLD